MTMGERIRAARQEAGMSQRELAGETLTRNMLSALEHDTANPSIGTLRYLSERLCKPIGYFVGETVIENDELLRLNQARQAFGAGNYQDCLDLLTGTEGLFRVEAQFLRSLSLLELARQAIKEERIPYARELLDACGDSGKRTPYFLTLEREWILLKARTDGGKSLCQLRNEDDALLLRAKLALEDGNLSRCGALLEAVEDRNEEWEFLMGEWRFRQGEYRDAAKHFHRVEQIRPDLTDRRLEICYRELEDYKQAYYYASKNRGD